MNCPVCEKSDIPDFIREPTVCPQCNSDLKAFMLLNQLEVEVTQQTINQTPDEGSTSPTNVYWKWLIPAIIIGLLAGRYLWPVTNDLEQRTIVQLRDSLAILHQLSTKQAVTPSVSQPGVSASETLYVIQKGDYLSKIAQRFYKSRQLYNRIAQDNGIRNVNKIKAGDTLRIK